MGRGAYTHTTTAAAAARKGGPTAGFAGLGAPAIPSPESQEGGEEDEGALVVAQLLRVLGSQGEEEEVMEGDEVEALQVRARAGRGGWCYRVGSSAELLLGANSGGGAAAWGRHACLCAHEHTHTHTCTHTHKRTHKRANTHAHAYTHAYAHSNTHISTNTHTHARRP